MSFCIYCGAPLNMDDRHCPQCGKPVGNGADNVQKAQDYSNTPPPQYQQPQDQQPQYQQPQYQQPQYPAYQQPTYARRVTDPATTYGVLAFIHTLFAFAAALFTYLGLADIYISVESASSSSYSYGTNHYHYAYAYIDDDFMIPAFIFCLAMTGISIALVSLASSKRMGLNKTLNATARLIGSALFGLLSFAMFA